MKLTRTQVGKARTALMQITGLDQYATVDSGVLSLVPQEVVTNPAKLWQLAINLMDQFEHSYQLTVDRMKGGLECVSSLNIPDAKLTPRRNAIIKGMAEMMSRHYRRTFSPHIFGSVAIKLREKRETVPLTPYSQINMVGVVDRGAEALGLSRLRRAALGLPYKEANISGFVGNCFTVELEFLAELDSALVGNESAKLFKEMTNPDVHFKGDSSVHSSNASHTRAAYQEVTVSVKWGNYKRLYELCKKMNDAGAEVNTTCGLHVHLDSRHLNKYKERARRTKLIKALSWLFELVPPSRRNNVFCVNNNRERASERRRYLAINPLSYRVHGTTEIRLGAGSLDPDKILNWATLLKFLADSKKSYPTFSAFLDSKAPQHIKVWAVLRRSKFMPEAGNSDEGSEANV